MKYPVGFYLGGLFAGLILACLVSAIPVVHRNGQEWSMKVKTPSCASYQNIQVIYPAKAGDPVEIECDDMGGAK